MLLILAATGKNHAPWTKLSIRLSYRNLSYILNRLAKYPLCSDCLRMINCRLAAIEDLPCIVAGNYAMAKETEGIDLSQTTIDDGVRAVLCDRKHGIYWVAEKEAEVVGQILVTYEWSDWRNAQIWWIQSVYVWPTARRTGVFTALLEHVTSEAIEASVCELRLYADTLNTNAHATYLNQGFKTGHYQVFEKSLR